MYVTVSNRSYFQNRVKVSCKMNYTEVSRHEMETLRFELNIDS